MTLFYFDLETTGDDPAADRIISIQVQQLSDAFEPIGNFQIMAEWEWGEKQIIEMLLEKGALQAGWDFVPIGNRLRFDLTFLLERATKWKLIDWDMATLKYFWFTKPYLDIQTILVLMNGGQFAGSALHAYSSKESGSRVPALYRKGAYKDIVEYCTRERNEALGLLREARGILETFGRTRKPGTEAKP